MATVPQIEIRNHPTSPVHKIVKAIVRGRVYAVTSAEPFPTVEEAQGIVPEYLLFEELELTIQRR